MKRFLVLLSGLLALACGAPAFAAGGTAPALLPTLFNVQQCAGLDPVTVATNIDETANLTTCQAVHPFIWIPNTSTYTLSVNGWIPLPGGRYDCQSDKYFAFQQTSTGMGTYAVDNGKVTVAPTAGTDTLQVGNGTLSFISGASSGLNVQVNGLSGTATNIVAAINANTSTLGVTAVVDPADSTAFDVTAASAGILGNNLPMVASNTSSIYVSAATLGAGGFTVATNPQSLTGVQTNGCPIYGNKTNVESHAAAVGTGYVTSGVMTIQSMTSGAFFPGGKIVATGINSGVEVGSQTTNTGTAIGTTGTYQLTFNQSSGSSGSPITITEQNAVNGAYFGNEDAALYTPGLSSGSVLPHHNVRDVYVFNTSGTGVEFGPYGRDSFFEDFTVRGPDNYGVLLTSSDANYINFNIAESAWDCVYGSPAVVNLQGAHKYWGCGNYSIVTTNPDMTMASDLHVQKGTRLTGTIIGQEASGYGLNLSGQGSNQDDTMMLTWLGDGNNGAYTTIGATTWLASTVYTVGQYRINGGQAYQVTTGGTSAASGGPTGQTSSITDGGVTWKWISVAPSALPEINAFRAPNSQINFAAGKVSSGLFGQPYGAINIGTGSINSRFIGEAGAIGSGYPYTVTDSTVYGQMFVSVNENQTKTCSATESVNAISPRPDQCANLTTIITTPITVANPPNMVAGHLNFGDPLNLTLIEPAPGLGIAWGSYYHTGQCVPYGSGANFLGYISSNTVTVTTLLGGTIATGQVISGTGSTPATISSGSGSTWTIGGSAQTIGSSSAPVFLTSAPASFVPYDGATFTGSLSNTGTLSVSGVTSGTIKVGMGITNSGGTAVTGNPVITAGPLTGNGSSGASTWTYVNSLQTLASETLTGGMRTLVYPLKTTSATDETMSGACPVMQY